MYSYKPGKTLVIPPNASHNQELAIAIEPHDEVLPLTEKLTLKLQGAPLMD